MNPDFVRTPGLVDSKGDFITLGTINLCILNYLFKKEKKRKMKYVCNLKRVKLFIRLGNFFMFYVERFNFSVHHY